MATPFSLLRAIAFAAVIGLATPLLARADTDTDAGTEAFRTSDYAAAMTAWLPLAKAGDPAAQFNVGVLHDEGLGVEENSEEARRWWTLAAEQGLPEAHHNLALLQIDLASSEDGGGDLEAALTHLTAAAEAGHLGARYTLGKLYEYGLGVEQDPAQSAAHIRQAAEAGLPKAQYNMGKRFRDGLGVEKDETIAAEWFRRAARAGHPGGQDHLARRLRDGQGVDADPVEAMAMAILATRAGYEDARRLAEELKEPLSIGELDQAFSRANEFKPESVLGPVGAEEQ